MSLYEIAHTGQRATTEVNTAGFAYIYLKISLELFHAVFELVHLISQHVSFMANLFIL